MLFRSIMVARYSDDDNFATARPVTVRLLNGRFPMEVSVHLTDVDRRHTEIRIAPKSETELCLMMDPHSFALVEFCCEGLAEGRGME